jgi:hypothetical protein
MRDARSRSVDRENSDAGRKALSRLFELLPFGQPTELNREQRTRPPSVEDAERGTDRRCIRLREQPPPERRRVQIQARPQKGGPRSASRTRSVVPSWMPLRRRQMPIDPREQTAVRGSSPSSAQSTTISSRSSSSRERGTYRGNDTVPSLQPVVNAITPLRPGLAGPPGAVQSRQATSVSGF